MIGKQKKVVLIGNFSVGKTSLIRRFVENSFSDSYISTIGVKISKKSIEIKNETLTLLIWDIEGVVDKIKKINETYIRGASGAIIVADITSLEIKNDLEMHLRNFYNVNQNVPCIIAFNKFDKDESFEISIEELKIKYPKIINSFKTSAKSGLNVEKMFEELSKEMLNGTQF